MMDIQEVKAERERLGKVIEQMQKDLLSIRNSAKEVERSLAHTQGAVAILDKILYSKEVVPVATVNGGE